eukprot:3184227-Karenia_brevis.AAC.1
MAIGMMMGLMHIAKDDLVAFKCSYEEQPWNELADLYAKALSKQEFLLPLPAGIPQALCFSPDLPW